LTLSSAFVVSITRHGDADVLTTTSLQIREDLHPELRAFGLLDPDAEDVARGFAQDGEGRSGSILPL
jgi:hypothetical protein